MKSQNTFTWWQVVLVCFAFLAIFLITAILSDLVTHWIKNRTIRFIIRELLLRLPITLLLMQLFAKKVLKRKPSSFNIRGFSSSLLKWFVIGAGISALFLILTILLNNTDYQYKGDQLTQQKIIYFIVSTVAMAINGGIIEETLFRGYIMQIIREKWNTTVAVVVPSMLFGLVHLSMLESFNFTDFTLLLLSGTLVSVMFSLMVIKTKTVYSAAIVHLVWNLFFAGKIMKISVDPLAEINSIYSIHIENGNTMLNGGGFGIEASLIAIVVYIGVSVFLVKAIKIKQQI